MSNRRGTQAATARGKANQLRPGDVIQCRECGYRILYKKRTKRGSLSSRRRCRPDYAENGAVMLTGGSEEVLDLAVELVLGDDLLPYILRCLSAQELCSVACVSPRWNELSKESGLWHTHFKHAHPQLGRQLQPSGRADWKRLYRAIDNVHKRLSAADFLPMDGIDSSSHKLDMTVGHTCHTFAGIWSSAPSPNPDGSEWLRYHLKNGPAIIQSVALLPFASGRCYAPREIQLFAGMSLDSCDYAGFPDYQPVRNESSMQGFAMPDLVFGEYVKLDLFGYYETHFMQGQEEDYYQCLHRVVLRGVSCSSDDIQDDYLREVLMSCASNAQLQEVAEPSDPLQKLTTETKPPAAANDAAEEVHAANVPAPQMDERSEQRGETEAQPVVAELGDPPQRLATQTSPPATESEGITSSRPSSAHGHVNSSLSTPKGHDHQDRQDSSSMDRSWKTVSYGAQRLLAVLVTYALLYMLVGPFMQWSSPSLNWGIRNTDQEPRTRLLSSEKESKELVEYVVDLRHRLDGSLVNSTLVDQSKDKVNWDVFISHRGPDVKHDFATMLWWHLKRFSTFLDYRSLRLGGNGLANIARALRMANVTIVILTPGFFKSKYCIAELEAALRYSSEGSPTLLPVFLGQDVNELTDEVRDNLNCKPQELTLCEACVLLDKITAVTGIVVQGPWDEAIRSIEVRVDELLKSKSATHGLLTKWRHTIHEEHSALESRTDVALEHLSGLRLKDMNASLQCLVESAYERASAAVVTEADMHKDKFTKGNEALGQFLLLVREARFCVLWTHWCCVTSSALALLVPGLHEYQWRYDEDYSGLKAIKLAALLGEKMTVYSADTCDEVKVADMVRDVMMSPRHTNARAAKEFTSVIRSTKGYLDDVCSTILQMNIRLKQDSASTCTSIWKERPASCPLNATFLDDAEQRMKLEFTRLATLLHAGLNSEDCSIGLQLWHLALTTGTNAGDRWCVEDFLKNDFPRWWLDNRPTHAAGLPILKSDSGGSDTSASGLRCDIEQPSPLQKAFVAMQGAHAYEKVEHAIGRIVFFLDVNTSDQERGELLKYVADTVRQSPGVFGQLKDADVQKHSVLLFLEVLALPADLDSLQASAIECWKNAMLHAMGRQHFPFTIQLGSYRFVVVFEESVLRNTLTNQDVPAIASLNAMQGPDGYYNMSGHVRDMTTWFLRKPQGQGLEMLVEMANASVLRERGEKLRKYLLPVVWVSTTQPVYLEVTRGGLWGSPIDIQSIIRRDVGFKPPVDIHPPPSLLHWLLERLGNMQETVTTRARVSLSYVNTLGKHIWVFLPASALSMVTFVLDATKASGVLLRSVARPFTDLFIDPPYLLILVVVLAFVIAAITRWQIHQRTALSTAQNRTVQTDEVLVLSSHSISMPPIESLRQFCDPASAHKVEVIRIRSGQWVDGICVTYRDAQNQRLEGTQHGGEGGDLHILELAEDEYIVKVSGRNAAVYGGVVLHDLRFQTSARKMWPEKGGFGGMSSGWGPPLDEFVLHNNDQPLLRFCGSEWKPDGSWYLSCLGAYFQSP
eukprot:jgi/Chlat1/4736/Chrsp30S04765